MFSRSVMSASSSGPGPADAFSQPPIGDWFPCKVTSVPAAGQYAFDEWWLNGDGTWIAKVGGRVGASNRYGVALAGTLAVDDYAWARAAPGAGGELFEMLPVSAGAATVSAWKESVRVATVVNGTLATAFENGDTVDGVVLATGNRILLKNQTTATENGIYTVNASGSPTRAADADAGSELLGATVFVSEGTNNKDTVWACTNNATITVGATSLAWELVGPPIATAEVGATANDPATYSITADTTWEDATGWAVTLPQAGTYLVHFEGTAFAAVDGDYISGGTMRVRLADGGGTAYGRTTVVVCGIYSKNDVATGIAYFGNFAITKIVAVTASTTVKLQAWRYSVTTTGTGWTFSDIMGEDNALGGHGLIYAVQIR